MCGTSLSHLRVMRHSDLPSNQSQSMNKDDLSGKVLLLKVPIHVRTDYFLPDVFHFAQHRAVHRDGPDRLHQANVPCDQTRATIPDQALTTECSENNSFCRSSWFR